MGPRERQTKAKSAAPPRGVHIRTVLAAALACGLTLAAAPAMGQTNGGGWSLVNGNIQKRAVDGVLAMMSYTVFPDVTTSTLSITQGSTGNPDFFMTQFGGGFTVHRSFPLYLEGNAAFTRYDPTFLADDEETCGLGVELFASFRVWGEDVLEGARPLHEDHLLHGWIR
jgi:hypothetical protein